MDPGDRVLIAFSGGADSLALLCALLTLRRELGVEIAAAHLDHGLRGALSAADADWAEAFCLERGVTFFRGYWAGWEEVRAGRSPEEAARRARRRFLEETLAQWPGDKIAMGHHLDDQAETVLIHLLNGTGLRGMGGMRPVQAPYIRPMLEISKREILAYVEMHGLAPRVDETNADQAYLRNKLRMQVVPMLRESNPSFAAVAGRMAALARREDDFLDRLAVDVLAECQYDARSDTRLPGYLATAWKVLASADASAAPLQKLSLDKLSAVDPVLAMRALRLWIADGAGGRSIDMQTTERLYALAVSGREGASVEVAGGVTVEKAKGCLVRRDRERRLPEGQTRSRFVKADADLAGDLFPLRILPGEEALLSGGRVRVCASRIAGTGASTGTGAGTGTSATPFDRYVCAWPAGAPYPILRYRAPGDWLQMPYGRKKLKDMLIEKGVPKELRDSFPLLAIGSRILWIPGVAKALTPDAAGGQQVEYTLYMS